MPIVLKATLLFAQEQPILDVAVVDVPGGYRPIVLGDGMVSIYRQQGRIRSELNPARTMGTRSFVAHRSLAHFSPRFARTPAACAAITCSTFTCPERSADRLPTRPRRLTITCNDTDDPWPLTSDDDGVRAFFAASRNFFTGALSPGIGKISNVPSFYSAAAFQRSELHAVGLRGSRRIAPPRGWHDRPGSPRREVGQRSGRGSLRLWLGNTSCWFRMPGYGARLSACI